MVDFGETDPNNPDTDSDGIQDGTELGFTAADIEPGTDTAFFQPDLDPATQTDPLNPDTDGDRIIDGIEDANQNGRVDPGEADPTIRNLRALPWIPLLLLGLLFMSSGTYLGFEYELSFLYFGVGFVCCAWSLWIFTMRLKHRSQQRQFEVSPRAGAGEGKQDDTIDHGAEPAA